MRSRMGDGSIAHIKLWASDSTIIWSDEPALIGTTFELEPDEAALFGTENVVSDLSDLSKPENTLEADESPLVEVYAGTFDLDGEPLLVEMYWPGEQIQAVQTAIVTRSAPLALGALFLFLLVILGLALSLARRVARGQVDRHNLLRDALAASELERGRLAQDLHDGVIQDLAGLSYAVPSVAGQLPPEMGSLRRVLDQVGLVLRQDVAALRTLLTDIYPADLASGGLETEVGVLARRAADSDVDVEVDIAEGMSDISLEVSRLVYRVVREGLRNVVKHAEATHAWVAARRVGPDVVVTVLDDGQGLVPDLDTEGHVGLRLLEQTVRDVGGRLTVENRPGGGVALTASFPLTFGADA
jgi:signal transduction histidine kinase